SRTSARDCFVHSSSRLSASRSAITLAYCARASCQERAASTRRPLCHISLPPIGEVEGRNAECLRGAEVDHQYVLVRVLHRQIGWLLGLEDAIDICRSGPVEMGRVGPIGQQAAVDGVATGRVDGRETVACRQCDEERTIGEGEGVREHYQTAAGRTRLCLDRRFHLADAANR